MNSSGFQTNLKPTFGQEPSIEFRCPNLEQIVPPTLVIAQNGIITNDFIFTFDLGTTGFSNRDLCRQWIAIGLSIGCDLQTHHLCFNFIPGGSLSMEMPKVSQPIASNVFINAKMHCLISTKNMDVYSWSKSDRPSVLLWARIGCVPAAVMQCIRHGKGCWHNFVNARNGMIIMRGSNTGNLGFKLYNRSHTTKVDAIRKSKVRAIHWSSIPITVGIHTTSTLWSCPNRHVAMTSHSTPSLLSFKVEIHFIDPRLPQSWDIKIKWINISWGEFCFYHSSVITSWRLNSTSCWISEMVTTAGWVHIKKWHYLFRVNGKTWTLCDSWNALGQREAL